MLLIRTIKTEKKKNPTNNKYGKASTVLNTDMVTNEKQLLDKDSCE